MIEFIHVFIVVCFAVSGVSKLFTIESFRKTLAALEFIPKKIINTITVAFPLIEIVTAILLMVNNFVILGLYIVLGMLASFALVAFRTLIAKREVKCNCFGGITDERIGASTIMKIVILTILATFLLMNLEVTDGLFTNGYWSFAIMFMDSLLLLTLFFLIERLKTYIKKINNSQ